MRERMAAQTSLVVVGSADDALRINKFNRHLEGVTQSMVDNMIAVRDFGILKIKSIAIRALTKHDEMFYSFRMKFKTLCQHAL